MQHVADGFTAVAVVAGLWAALQWWRSRKVQVRDVSGLDVSTLEGMIDPRNKAAMREAIERTDTLNSRAAVWTPVSVATQAVAAVLGRLAMP